MTRDSSTVDMHAAHALLEGARQPGTNSPPWLPAEPSTHGTAADTAGAAQPMQGMYADATSSAVLQDAHSVSEMEEAAAGGHAPPLTGQSVVGFNLQQPAARYPYHGSVRATRMSVAACS